jgi:hypothetical protein
MEKQINKILEGMLREAEKLGIKSQKEIRNYDWKSFTPVLVTDYNRLRRKWMKKN